MQQPAVELKELSPAARVYQKWLYHILTWLELGTVMENIDG
jgi:hypothetical protein